MATVGSLIVEMGMDIARLQSDVEKARVSLDSVDKNVSKLERSFGKLTSVYEYANTALKRMHSLLSGLAFGFVIGLVSELTSGIMKWWTEMRNAEENTKKLREAILNQASAWKLLPEDIGKANEATINLWNTQLGHSQFLERNTGKILKQQIDKIKEAIEANEEWRKNLENIKSTYFDVASSTDRAANEYWKLKERLAELNLELIEHNKLMGLQPTNLNVISAALGQNTSIYRDRTAIIQEAIYQHDELAKAESRHYIELGKGLDVLQESIRLEQEAQYENYKTSASIFMKTEAEIANIQAKQKNLELGLSKQIVAESSPYAAQLLQYNEYIVQLREMQKTEIDLLKTQQQAEMAMHYAHGASLRELAELKTNQIIALKEKEFKQSIKLDELRTTVGIRTLSIMLSATGAMLMQGNKKQFEAGKKLAYAGAVVSTAQAVMNALATPPFPLGLMLAGLAAATGAMQIATIAKMEYGGGGGGITAPVTGGGIGGGYEMPDILQPETKLPTQNITINVYNPLDGKVSDELTDAIIQAINDAPNRNVTINAQAVY